MSWPTWSCLTFSQEQWFCSVRLKEENPNYLNSWMEDWIFIITAQTFVASITYISYLVLLDRLNVGIGSINISRNSLENALTRRALEINCCWQFLVHLKQLSQNHKQMLEKWMKFAYVFSERWFSNTILYTLYIPQDGELTVTWTYGHVIIVLCYVQLCYVWNMFGVDKTLWAKNGW